MSLRSIYDILVRHLKDVFKTSSKTFWRPFGDIFARRIEDILKMYDKGKYIRPDQDVFKASWRRFLKTYRQANIFALLKISWRRFKDFSEDEDGRHLLNVFKMSSTRGMFAGIWKIDLCLFEYWTSLLVTLSSLTILSTIYNVLKVISHYKQELLGFDGNSVAFYRGK